MRGLHLEIGAILGDLYNPPVIHARYSIRVVKDSRVVRYDDKRSIAVKRFVPKKFHYLTASCVIKRARGFVAYN